MTMRVVYACDGCGRIENADGALARTWMQLYTPGARTDEAGQPPALLTRDRHFCAFACLETYAKAAQVASDASPSEDGRDEPGATQPGTRQAPRTPRVALFRPSHGKGGNADDSHDGEIIHKDC